MKEIGNSFWFSLVVTALLHAVCYAFFDIYYLTHDDVAMALTAKGYFTGTPDAHLVFINAIYGYLLQWLYGFWPAIEWYSAVLLGVQFLSITAIGFLLKTRTNALAYGTFCVVSTYFILNLQFTNVAFLALIAGLLRLVLLKKNEPWHQYAIGVAFVFAAFLIRSDVALLGGFVAIPFLYRLDRKWIVSGLALMVLFGWALWADMQAYSNPEWSYYAKYNKARGAINDNPNVAVLSNDTLALKKIGVTVEEFAIFNNLSPTKNLTLEKLEAIHELVKWPPGIYFYLKNIFQTYMAAVLFIGIAIVAFYRRRELGKIKLALLLFVVADGIICLNHYPKDRVIFGLLVMVFFFGLVSFSGQRRLPIGICSMLFLLFFAYGIADTVKKSPAKFEFQEPLDNNTVPLFLNYRTFFGKVKPFSLPRNGDNKVLAVSWLANSPIQLEQVRQLSVNAKQHFSPIDSDAMNEKCLYMGDTSKQSKDYINGTMKIYLATQNKKTILVKEQKPFIIYSIAKNDTIQ